MILPQFQPHRPQEGVTIHLSPGQLLAVLRTVAQVVAGGVALGLVVAVVAYAMGCGVDPLVLLDHLPRLQGAG